MSFEAALLTIRRQESLRMRTHRPLECAALVPLNQDGASFLMIMRSDNNTTRRHEFM